MENLFIGGIATTEIILVLIFGLIPANLFIWFIIAIIRYLNRKSKQ